MSCAYKMQISSHRLKISFGDSTIDKTSSKCIAYMKIRTLRLMVAVKTSNPQGNPFLKSQEVQYLILYAKMKFQTSLFSKAKMTTNAICHFYAIKLVDVCVTCLSLDVSGC